MTAATQGTAASVTHGSFTVERTYASAPVRVFAAWASRDAKNAWFGEGDDFLTPTTHYELDFRVGGREVLEGMRPGGRLFGYEAIYQDIMENRRIIASYDVRIGGQRYSVSLLTVEFHEIADGTRLVLTEQGAFLDGLDSNEQRVEGAGDSLDKLGQYLESGDFDIFPKR
jgi:uncharacterized protein YndB with AHSA1/START domain